MTDLKEQIAKIVWKMYAVDETHGRLTKEQVADEILALLEQGGELTKLEYESCACPSGKPCRRDIHCCIVCWLDEQVKHSRIQHAVILAREVEKAKRETAAELFKGVDDILCDGDHPDFMGFWRNDIEALKAKYLK